jgi:hypothetical protein
MGAALSDETTGLSFKLLLALASAVILGSESRSTHDNILLTKIRDSNNLFGQVPAFIFPRNRVAQLYPQALGFFFVSSYDSQGYGGGIRTRLYVGYSQLDGYSSYIASGRTQQKTPFLTVPLSWVTCSFPRKRVYRPLPSNGSLLSLSTILVSAILSYY